MTEPAQPVRLTTLAHGGGCGCKLSPSVLRELLAESPAGAAFPQLLVGNASADDAAVWQLDDRTCVIATTDFFMPMVDDARDFGRIAATNAISDVYAMGGRPLMALAILGMPVGKVPADQARAILQGGAEICAEAGIPVAGGHSIDSAEPIYGLAVIGTAPPGRIRRNDAARPGDALILTKPLGVGIYSAAYKRGLLDAADYAEMVDTMTRLNRVGEALAMLDEVHALTDVTGFGLAGHGLELARGAGVSITVDTARLPLLSRTEALARAGAVTGASGRNWASFDGAVTLAPALDAVWRDLVSDPQTSGGLLVSVAAPAADATLARIRDAGFDRAAIIGTVGEGPAGMAFR